MDWKVGIAETVLSLVSTGGSCAYPLDSPYSLFVVGSKGADVEIGVRLCSYSGPFSGEEVFSISALPAINAPITFPSSCRVFRDHEGLWKFETRDSKHSGFRGRVAVFDPAFRSGALYAEVEKEHHPVFPSPLSPLLDRLLLVNVLGRRVGLLLHACAVSLNGLGHIFLGPSGAGKTTLARLWTRVENATVLGDECVVVRKKGSEYWVYGTPWAQERAFCSPMGVPLERVYFLQHGRQNELGPVVPEEAMKQLLFRSSLPVYDSVATQGALDACQGIAATISAYSCSFVPDMSAVRMLQSFAEHE